MCSATLMCAQIDTCSLSLSLCPHLQPSLTTTSIFFSRHFLYVCSSFSRCPPPSLFSILSYSSSSTSFSSSSPSSQTGYWMVALAGGIPGRVIWLWCNVNHIARDFQPATAETHTSLRHLAAAQQTPTLAEVTALNPFLNVLRHMLCNLSSGL